MQLSSIPVSDVVALVCMCMYYMFVRLFVILCIDQAHVFTFTFMTSIIRLVSKELRSCLMTVINTKTPLTGANSLTCSIVEYSSRGLYHMKNRPPPHAHTLTLLAFNAIIHPPSIRRHPHHLNQTPPEPFPPTPHIAGASTLMRNQLP